MDKNKKKLVLMILAIMSLVVITAGVTYAFFSYTKEGTKDNTITTGTITFLYTEVSGVGKGISLTDAFPITDIQGKKLTGEGNVFDFKVTSTTPNKTAIPYEVTARKSSDSTLVEEAVRIYLTKVSGTSEEEVLLDNYNKLPQTTKVQESKYTEKTIYEGKVPADSSNYEQNFRLRMWVDEDTKFSPVKDENGNEVYPYNDKKFTITVNVYANAKVVTEEDIADASKAEISSISVGNTELTKVENQAYDYETGLPEGTTSTTLDVETQGEYSTVTVERIDSLAYSSNIKRLSTKKTLELNPGDNYFKITVTSENGKVENEYTLKINVGIYKEVLLNGADPILSDNLTPVLIADDGTVTKANINAKWYSYEDKCWANAVVLRDTTEIYNVGDSIDEDDIESYFVWIPKYSYKLWDLGNYTGVTSVDTTKPKPILIKFGLTNTSDSVTGECTTPMNEDGTQGLAGKSGLCQVGDYMTHPAFLSFDSTGFWVGKFETGYDGATSKSAAQTNVDKVDTSKIIIKPNVYTWRNIKVGNMFENSYQYLRNDDSHMMKNTEWGAISYLQHSAYGSQISLRVNNNNNHITGYAAIEEPTKGNNKDNASIAGNRLGSTSLGVDGTYTVNYLNSKSVVASTTGNKSGIYDMSGGGFEYVMGYTTGTSIGVGGSSGITSLYPKFFTNSKYNKYYDKYSAATVTNYNNRILGDATGEMGSFFSESDPDGSTRNKSSWYKDYAFFVKADRPWFVRGGDFGTGTLSGAFAFGERTGSANTGLSFRIVLAPTK